MSGVGKAWRHAVLGEWMKWAMAAQADLPKVPFSLTSTTFDFIEVGAFGYQAHVTAKVRSASGGQGFCQLMVGEPGDEETDLRQANSANEALRYALAICMNRAVVAECRGVDDDMVRLRQDGWMTQGAGDE